MLRDSMLTNDQFDPYGSNWPSGLYRNGVREWIELIVYAWKTNAYSSDERSHRKVGLDSTFDPSIRRVAYLYLSLCINWCASCAYSITTLMSLVYRRRFTKGPSTRAKNEHAEFHRPRKTTRGHRDNIFATFSYTVANRNNWFPSFQHALNEKLHFSYVRKMETQKLTSRNEIDE